MTYSLTTRTPHMDPFGAIERAPLAQTTKRQYRKALRKYLETGARITDAQALADHADTLPNSSKAFLKAAIKLVSGSMASDIKGQATPDNVDAVHAALLRFEAMNDAIQVRTPKGEKAHIWLSSSEVRRLLSLPGHDIVGERDRLALALLVAAGLRRAELASLQFSDVVPQGERTVLQIRGKGAKQRVVPISHDLARMIERWGDRIGHEGKIMRALGMNKQPSEGMTGAAIFELVRRYGDRLGKPDLAPHDLRRTYAQIGLDAGVPIQQISVLLGHSSVVTTQRYLNLELDLETTISDFVPLCS